MVLPVFMVLSVFIGVHPWPVFFDSHRGFAMDFDLLGIDAFAGGFG
jgi:hypothetical protein